MMINILTSLTSTDYIVHTSICVILSAVMLTHHNYLLCLSIPLNSTMNTVVVTPAATISFTGSSTEYGKHLIRQYRWQYEYKLYKQNKLC